MVLHTYNGCRGFGCEDNLQEIMCLKSFGGLRFDLRSLLQGRLWSLIPLIVYISLIINFGCEDESFGGVTFDIFCMSRYNHVPSGDTLCRDAISSYLFYFICLFIFFVCVCNFMDALQSEPLQRFLSNFVPTFIMMDSFLKIFSNYTYGLVFLPFEADHCK